MSSWFRAYSETLNDPKVQTLPLEAFKAWHNALYLAASMDSRTGNIGTIDAIAFAFRETKQSVSSAFHPLIEAGLLVTVGETFQIVSWQKRQYKSDTSTERVKRFRKRSRNVTETAPDTDTEQSITLSKDNVAPVDSDTQFWEAAKGYLADASKNPGALIGKWARDYGKPETAEAITRAQLERPVQKIAFIQGALKAKARDPARLEYGPC